ncbi:MAG: AI-2E family transporter [Candidatus Promineifilaceae bacterium]|nr:AI-2E family transporter [Candidatus Promineifilaceae bacterium]
MNSFEIPEIPARQLLLWTLAAAAVIGCFWFLWRFQNVLLLIVTGIILSTAIRPGVLWMEKRGVPQSAGILLIFGLIAAVLGLLTWYSLPILTEQGTAITQNLVDGYRSWRLTIQQVPNILVRRLLIILPTDPHQILGLSSDVPLTATDPNMPAAGIQENGLLVGFFQFLTVAILTFYWTLESNRVKQAAYLLVPLKRREGVRELVQALETKVGGYLLGQGLLCLTIGIMAFIAYMLIGLPNALLLAIIAGLLEAVPIVGPFLGAVPAIAVGLSVSPLTALWVLIATGVIQQLENSFLVPRIMNRTIGVRPLVTLLALLAFGSLFGVLGALVALPLAAVIQVLMDRYLLNRESLEQADPGRDKLSVLRYETNQLVQDVRNQVRHKSDVPTAQTDALEDEVEAIAMGLEGYLLGQGELKS